MSWELFRITLKLCSPLHVGWKKQGNIQYTFPYLHGRALWGALTYSLTRLEKENPIDQDYQHFGECITDQMRLFYFFPMTKPENAREKTWYPIDADTDADLNSHLIHSYSANALDYESGSTGEGLLHEVEYICSHDKTNGDTVFLVGYLAVQKDSQLKWQEALKRMQLGGERGYGFGKVSLERCEELTDVQNLKVFDRYPVILDQVDGVRIKLNHIHAYDNLLLAHMKTGITAEGILAPFVGRMWRNNSQKNGPGQSVDFHGCCWEPGSLFKEDCEVEVGKFGIWN